MEQNTGAAQLSTVARMRLNAQLMGLVREKSSITLVGPMAALKVAKVASQIIAVLSQLGVDLGAKDREKAAFEVEGGPEPVEVPRMPSSHFYDFDPDRTNGQRKKDNAAAMALLTKIDSGEVDGQALTDEQRTVLAKYSGTGGALVGADGKKGSAYEYYTPKPIAQGMWDLMRELGFNGGKVLDPSSGTGIFGGVAPLDAVVDSVELNETSGRINALVNGGPGYSVEISSFEKIAARTPDETYDAVITNVPFGSVADRGGNELGDSKYQKEPLQNYFILRSIEKLKPGGLAAFITPPRCVSGLGGKEEDLRIKASYMAEFMGAYRLPNVVFGTAQADTITDVIVFRKFGRDAAQKIEELRESAPAKLVEAKVLWPEFVGGKYFTGEGKRFILGEFVPKNPNDFRPVDRVVSDQSVPNIAKLLRKFPGSRIDWALIEAAETAPIVYAEGDTVTQKGQTLQMVDGVWAPVKSNEASAVMAEMGGRMTTPMVAFTQGVKWAQAVEYVQYMKDTSQSMDVPDWVRGVVAELSRLGSLADRSTYWNAGLVGMSVDQVLSEGGGVGTNYLTEYPGLSEAMKRVAADARGCPGSVGGAIKSGMRALGVHYTRKGGYSGVWSGNVVADMKDGRSADQRFEGVKYAGQGVWVPRDVAASLFEGETFDPIADPGWCLSDDGKSVARADDYFIGNYGDMIARLDAAAKLAEDPVIKGKFLAQRAEAERRVDRVDVGKVSFNLFSPYATIDEKAEFLRRFASPGFAVAYDEETGKPYIEFTERDSASDTTATARRKKLHRRMAQYLKNGTVTLGGADVGDEREAMAALRDMIGTANEQFNGWCKANASIIDRLSESANDPSRLYFRQVDDESQLSIPGMSGNVTPHGYQNSFIRRMGRNFSGINGFGVGLGKAQPLDAKIMTPDGWVRMGDIKVGDFVIAGDGTPTAVTGVYPQGEKEIFEVEFSDGAKTRCCDEHLWFTETENDRKKTIYHASNGRSVAFGAVKSLSEIRDSLIYGKKQKNHKIPMVEPVQLTEKKLDIHPYLMGVLLGDGSLSSGSVTFTKDDPEVANRICSLLRDDFGSDIELSPITCQAHNRSQSWILKRTSSSGCNPLLDTLRTMGLMGVLSHQKFVPDDYMRGSIQQRVDLLHGLMDTDGYVSKDGITVQFCSTSRMLAGAVVELVQSLGGIAWISSKTPTFTHKGAKKAGRIAFTVSVRMPHSINPFSLARKSDRVVPKSKYLPVRYFTAVRPCGSAPAQCISIDHPSRLYVTDDYIVTHNTLTALASVAHVQSIGAKKKTAFIVPNSVLSNWRKEAANVYSSMEDCLFVGLTVNEKTGKAKVASSDYDRDLNAIRENRHRKIFMTMEAFQRLRLKDETIDAYERFMRSVDASFAESEDKKADEVAKGKSKRLVAILKDGKSGAAPFLEDLGIDSIVVDEAHAYKNSASTVAFKSAKFLALAPSATRGIDAQAKAWYIRGRSPLKDGVLLLTATPITNSPLEVYSMLSLAVGRDRVNDMAMGIKGADAFMDVMTRVESEEDETMDGIVRDTRIFKGLENVGILRKALGDVAAIKDADSVGQQVKVPDADEVSTPVSMPDPPILETLMQYKGAFRYAIDSLSERGDNRGDQVAFDAVAAKFGEPMNLIGHPFNLIQKMTMLIMDPELDQRATFYQVSKSQESIAEKVIAAFNGKKFTEERARPGPHTGEGSVVGTITRKDGDEKITLLKIQVAAKLVTGKIIIDTITPDTQTAFEAMAEKEGLELDVSVPPKLAALLENVTKEESNPRGVDGEGNPTPRVKQLIFCDILPLHNKIKRLLTRRAGIPSSAIAIITGQQNNTPDEIMAVQDGFNADGEDNKYRVVIANEKAEVGINLQRGTQAIHHLTIGWTPDSLTQRNGRGVRQGNKTERVTVYTYDADGTFDSHKRAMVSKKSGWIDQVMDVNGGDAINVEGGMSREQIEALIDTVGDADAMTRLQERLAAKEREVRAVGVRAKQTVNIRTIEASRKFLADNAESKAWAGKRFAEYFRLSQRLQEVNRRLENPKISATALVKAQSLQADLNARADGMRRALNEALTIIERGTVVDVDRLMAATAGSYLKRGDDLGVKMEEAVTMGRYGITVTVNDGCSLVDEWRSEVDMATSMVNEAKASFAKYARQDGGLPVDVIEQFAQGRGVMLDGKPIVDGAFIRVDGGFGVVTDGGMWVTAWRDGRHFQSRPANYRNKFDVILPGSPDYDAMLTEAAKLEDDMARDGVALPANDAKMLYSSLVPAVSQRRTIASLVLCDAGATGLAAPQFPVVLDPELAKVGPVLAAIVEAQGAVVKRYEANKWGDGKFTTEATTELVTFGPERYNHDFRLKPLLAFARANGMRLKVAEMKVASSASTYHGLRLVVASVPAERIESVLTGTDENALNAAADKWVAALMPDVDFEGESALRFLSGTERDALQAAIKRTMTPPQVPVSEVVGPAPTAADDGDKKTGIGENDWVGVSGNTKAWKEQIKAVASSVGDGFVWDGDATQWNVQHKSWLAIGNRFPSAVAPGQLRMVEFSGKYPRGFSPKK